VYADPPLERAGLYGVEGWGVINGIIADPRGCSYGSVCRHMAHGACGPGWDTWHGI
jgi:hypothetical protein